MFTGIVEEVGRVRSVEAREGGARFVIGAASVLADAEIGASIAVNGCCLTVVELGDGSWAADAVTETLARTTLGALASGDPVNLERPVRLADRLGGHLVQGHVDGVVALSARAAQADGSVRLTFALPPALGRYVVEKGSVAVDGVSLTVASRDLSGCSGASGGGASFDVAAIPHTLAVTTLGPLPVGGRANLEVDVLAKYVESLLPPTDPPTDPTASPHDRPHPHERNRP